MKYVFCLKSPFMCFFFSSSSSEISLVFLWFLLEGRVLSNKIEPGILTLLLPGGAKKILVFSHHRFHSFHFLREKHHVSLLN